MVSKQALNDRFNDESIEFMKEIFNEMLYKQNSVLSGLESNLKLNFNSVIINDSTSFTLPNEFKKEYAGSGGVTSGAAIKIQLQYDLLLGMFMCCDIFSGTKNDADYLETMEKYNSAGDLKLVVWDITKLNI